MARNRYLTRKGFAAWLGEHADEVVGVTRRSEECPISEYLGDQTKRSWHVSTLACVPQVDPEPGEDPDALNHEFRPPRWARDFIFALDIQFGRQVREVLGRDALYTLNEAVA